MGAFSLRGEVPLGGCRPLSDPLVWSNLSLLLPVAIYLSCGAYAVGFSVTASSVASVLYHSSYECAFIALDQWCAVVAFLATLTLTTRMTLLANAVLSVSVVAAFACYLHAIPFREKEPARYTAWHTLWHLLICLGQLQVAASLL
eukprot:GGOE01013852.1.p2 GENE.GGOE01013852.1~~GGOE01013852.1.p2  ORF type:complete len:162 (-),score=38.41 GGOE01013852.1:146-580(-)